MSEDDVDMLGPDGQGSARVDRDRRAPRFSWTPAYEATFFRSLCDSVQLGMRENSSFKAEAWERAAQALQESHGAYPAKSHLINKSDNARKRFRLWRGLREDPDFLYSSLARTVTATEEAWRSHIEKEPLSRALRGRPFEHEEFMEMLYPDVIGSGGAPKRVMKPRRRTDGQPGDESEMPGTSILNLQADASGADSQQSPPQPQQSSSRQISNLESPSHLRPTLSQTHSGSSSGSSVPPQRPMATTLPPRLPAGQPSALTPPDEPASQARKRTLVMAPAQGVFEASPSLSSTTSGLAAPSSASPDKRRRTSFASEPLPINPAVTLNSSVPPVPKPPASMPTLTPPLTGSDAAASGGTRTAIDELLDALKARTCPKWQEGALELFFRDFAGEDMDLQIKIAESVLSDESRAMVFCKMPPPLRRHWVGRFREGHRGTG